MHYSLAEAELAAFAERHGIPVVETVAGKSTLTRDHPRYAGPIGVIGGEGANRLAAEADVVLAVGTRLRDFTTGSWTVFADPDVRLIGVNAARFDAGKHLSLPVVGDAREALVELDAGLGDWRRRRRGRRAIADEVADAVGVPRPAGRAQPTGCRPTPRSSARRRRAGDRRRLRADRVGRLSRRAQQRLAVARRRHVRLRVRLLVHGLRAVAAAGARRWPGAAWRPTGDTIVFVGDGSYLMMNSDLYSSVLSGHPMIVVVCDNGGFAVIDRLQVNQGGESFNNLLADVARRGRAGARRLRRPRRGDGLQGRTGGDDRRAGRGLRLGAARPTARR